MDYVWIAVMAAGLGAVTWWAYRSDPHWVSKDGRLFTCRIQRLGDRFAPQGRWREFRVAIEDSVVVVRPRGRRAAARSTVQYRVVKRAEEMPRRMAIYIVDADGTSGHAYATLRIPAKSRAVAQLDALIQQN